MRIVCPPPLCRYSGEPHPTLSPFLLPRPSLTEHTFGDIGARISMTTNESVEVSAPTSVGNIKTGHGPGSGLSTNSPSSWHGSRMSTR